MHARDERFCPACASLIAIPGELHLGSFPAGTRVPMRIAIRNRATRTVSFPVTSLHPALVVMPRIMHLAAGAMGEVSGLISIGQLLPGPHRYRVRFETSTRPETVLLVEVVPPIVRLEFAPAEIVFPNALPGATARRSATVTNTGNLPVIATLSSMAAWLEILPSRLMLDPGASASATITARPRKTDCGIQTGVLHAATSDGHSWELPIQLHLPTPALALMRWRSARCVPSAHRITRSWCGIWARCEWPARSQPMSRGSRSFPSGQRSGRGRRKN